MKQIIIDSVKKIAKDFNIEAEAVMTFIDVETGGKGFNDDGKIIIQFEPAWFRKMTQYAPSGKWSLNKVDVQSKEWEAFNNAFSINADGAMMATSIGLGQIMGFHYRTLGYKTVGEMWDDAKISLDRQIWQIFAFIASNSKLLNGLNRHNWDAVATNYNGAGYKALAKKIGREAYDISLMKAYKKYKAV